MAVTVTRSAQWAMGHRLQRHDGLCRNVHGHNYEAEVTVERFGGMVVPYGNTAPDAGMVVDFAVLDRIIKAVVDEWDHAFMVEADDPLRVLLSGTIVNTKLVVIEGPPTAEVIATELAMRLHGPAWQLGLLVTRVRVHEGPKSVAEVTRGEGHA